MTLESRLFTLCASGTAADFVDFQELLTSFGLDEERYYDLIHSKDSSRYTPLHRAIFSRNIEAVRFLINARVELNNKCFGTPILHLVIRTAAQPDSYEFGLEAIKLMLEVSDRINFNAKDDNTMTAVHLAAGFGMSEILSLLIANPAGLECVRVVSRMNGFTTLTMAVMADSAECVEQLFAVYCPSEAMKTKLVICGSTPFHTAVRFKSTKAWTALVSNPICLEYIHTKDAYGRSPFDMLSEDKWEVSPDFKTIYSVDTNTSKGTLLVSNPTCLQHHTCQPSQAASIDAPPENVHRLEVLIGMDGILGNTLLDKRLQWALQAPNVATISDVLRVHEWPYVRQVSATCENIGPNAEKENGLFNLDSDTAISHKTYDAAVAAASSVIHAIDEVMKGNAKNAFCAVRPPGHHAGPSGVVKSNTSDSHGFCIFNNISVGAAYAMNRYRDTIKRVAIVDFDVHHGNGTEETVRWLKPSVEQSTVFTNAWFGHTQAPVYKPWLSADDSENVLFVSVHGYGPRDRSLKDFFHLAPFYPGTGATKLPSYEAVTAAYRKTQENTSMNIEEERRADAVLTGDGESELPKSISDDEQNSASVSGDEFDENDDDSFIPTSADLPGGPSHPVDRYAYLMGIFSSTIGQSINSTTQPLILDIGCSLPEDSVGATEAAIDRAIKEIRYRLQWRRQFRQEIFPRLASFHPDLILISAGFDAHKKDAINSGYIALTEEDFAWVTDGLVEIANLTNGGRIVSCLEGGYMIRGEYTSAFSKSVFAHVQSLRNGADSNTVWSPERNALEDQLDEGFLNDLMNFRNAEVERVRQRQAEKAAAAAAAAEKAAAAAALAESTSESAIIEEISSPGEIIEGRRKRTKVDYAALDAELRQSTLPPPSQ